MSFAACGLVSMILIYESKATIPIGNDRRIASSSRSEPQRFLLGRPFDGLALSCGSSVCCSGRSAIVVIIRPILFMVKLSVEKKQHSCSFFGMNDPAV